MLLEIIRIHIVGKWKMIKYHSSLAGYKQNTSHISTYFKSDLCTVFQHDICVQDTLPSEFLKCDILYVEIPWKKGFDVFNERAEIKDKRTYHLFLNHLSKLILNTGTPIIILGGKESNKLLPEPASQQILINSHLNTNYPFIANIYHLDSIPNFSATEELFDWMSEKFNCIGDFMCGYGTTGREFIKKGKTCVLSDYNKYCVGYISEHILLWEKE